VVVEVHQRTQLHAIDLEVAKRVFFDALLRFIAQAYDRRSQVREWGRDDSVYLRVFCQRYHERDGRFREFVDAVAEGIWYLHLMGRPYALKGDYLAQTLLALRQPLVGRCNMPLPCFRRW
jgi:hypothetical protein